MHLSKHGGKKLPPAPSVLRGVNTDAWSPLENCAAAGAAAAPSWHMVTKKSPFLCTDFSPQTLRHQDVKGIGRPSSL